jgi:shikimate 5-dehydrogenase
MKTFHLIGQNIHTSLSPLIHNFLFEIKGLSAKGYHYSFYEKDSVMLTLEKISKSREIGGLSITIPFKQGYEKELREGRLRGGVCRVGDEGEGENGILGKKGKANKFA